MDIQALISSGLLENYVLGLATAEENEQVTQLMHQYPQVRKEIEAIEAALLHHAEAQSDAPSANVKAQLFERINSVNQENVITHPVAFRKQNSNDTLRWLAAASVLLFFVSASVNFYLYNNWKDAEQKVVALNNEKVQLAQEFNVQQSRYQLMESSLSVLQSPYNKPVVLKGLPVSPSSLAMVYWNTQTHEVFINTRALPTPPAGKQYQLWALADGKPIDAGVFDVTDSTQLQKMKVIDAAQAFAVTLENAGGSPTPTLTAMYLMGSI